MVETSLWIATNLASYGFSKGLDRIFKNELSFATELKKVIDQSIDEYSTKYYQSDIGGDFPFYKSDILIQELLKARLYNRQGYNFNENKIQYALEANPNITKPSNTQITLFLTLFDKNFHANIQLKKLEIEEFHKEEIFNISEKVDSVISLLEIQLIEEVGLLKEEYESEIEECYEEIKQLKPKTAGKRIKTIEDRIENNSKHVSERTKAKLQYVKAMCYESLSEFNESYECYINAYNLLPSNKQYQDKACISYFYLGDKKHKGLMSKIETWGSYNESLWAIKAFSAENPLLFIQDIVPKNVIAKHRFSRLVFNFFMKEQKFNKKNLLELLEFEKIPKQLPEVINYINLYHWVFVLNAKFIDFISLLNIPFLGYLTKNEHSIYLLELTRFLSKAIKDSELEGEIYRVVFYSIWLESEIDIQEDTMYKIKLAYNALKTKDSFVSLLFANSLQKRKNKKEAIDFIGKYKGEINDELHSLLIFCNQDNPEANSIIYNYIEKLNFVDDILVPNICNIGLTITPEMNIDYDKLSDIFNSITFSNQGIKELVHLIFNKLNESSTRPSIEELDSLKNNLIEFNELTVFVAIIYFDNNYFSECAKIIKPLVDDKQESRELLLYIQSLNKNKTENQLELLNLLEKWRKNFTFFDEFIRVEIELRQLIDDKDKIIEISSYALSKMPNDEMFYAVYIVTLNQLERKEIIDSEIEKIKDFHFENTYYTLRIARVLLDCDYIDLGLELVYKKAINKEDADARMNFLFLTSKYQSYLKEYDLVEIGKYVRYEINGENKTILISSKLSNDPLVKGSLGKKRNETFLFETKFNDDLVNGKIIRIMNKYMALTDDIIAEASSSFSNLPMKHLHFENNSIESVNKVLIENFGSQDSQIKEIQKKRLNEYYNYKNTFTELTTSNFDSNHIDAYYSLTSETGKGFVVLPLQYQESNPSFNNIVLDFTSSLLFFELSKQLDLKFENLTAAKTLINLIDVAIFEANENKDVRITLSYQRDKVIPHFYDNDFHNNRIDFLNEIKDWVLHNVKIIVPKERVDILRSLSHKIDKTFAIEFLIDTFLLSQRENYILVSDDLGYSKLLNNQANQISSEKFLLLKFSDQNTVLSNYLLSKKYIGLTITKDVLYEAYINQQKGIKDDTYHFALRNIELKSNLCEIHIETIVFTLKEIALNQVITQENFKRDAVTMYYILLSSFSKPRLFLTVKKKTIEQFQLLGIYYNLALESLNDAYLIKTKNI